MEVMQEDVMRAAYLKVCVCNSQLWSLQAMRWMKVATLLRNSEETSSTFHFLLYVPSPLILSFVGMEMNGGEGGGGDNPPLSLPCSRCLCNLHTGLQSATEPLFIRLILKSTFCRPRKRLAKL